MCARVHVVCGTLTFAKAWVYCIVLGAHCCAQRELCERAVADPEVCSSEATAMRWVAQQAQAEKVEGGEDAVASLVARANSAVDFADDETDSESDDDAYLSVALNCGDRKGVGGGGSGGDAGPDMGGFDCQRDSGMSPLPSVAAARHLASASALAVSVVDGADDDDLWVVAVVVDFVLAVLYARTALVALHSHCGVARPGAGEASDALGSLLVCALRQRDVVLSWLLLSKLVLFRGAAVPCPPVLVCEACRRDRHGADARLVCDEARPLCVCGGVCVGAGLGGGGDDPPTPSGSPSWAARRLGATVQYMIELPLRDTAVGLHGAAAEVLSRRRTVGLLLEESLRHFYGACGPRYDGVRWGTPARQNENVSDLEALGRANVDFAAWILRIVLAEAEREVATAPCAAAPSWDACSVFSETVSVGLFGSILRAAMAPNVMLRCIALEIAESVLMLAADNVQRPGGRELLKSFLLVVRQRSLTQTLGTWVRRERACAGAGSQQHVSTLLAFLSSVQCAAVLVGGSARGDGGAPPAGAAAPQPGRIAEALATRWRLTLPTVLVDEATASSVTLAVARLTAAGADEDEDDDRRAAAAAGEGEEAGSLVQDRFVRYSLEMGVTGPSKGLSVAIPASSSISAVERAVRLHEQRVARRGARERNKQPGGHHVYCAGAAAPADVTLQCVASGTPPLTDFSVHELRPDTTCVRALYACAFPRVGRPFDECKALCVT